MATRRKPQSLKAIFGLNVKLERTRLGLTQEKLAARIETDQAYLSQVERALVVPSLDFVERVAAALEVRPTDLLDDTLGRKQT